MEIKVQSYLQITKFFSSALSIGSFSSSCSARLDAHILARLEPRCVMSFSKMRKSSQFQHFTLLFLLFSSHSFSPFLTLLSLLFPFYPSLLLLPFQQQSDGRVSASSTNASHCIRAVPFQYQTNVNYSNPLIIWIPQVGCAGRPPGQPYNYATPSNFNGKPVVDNGHRRSE